MPDQKIDNLLNLAMDATPQERRKSGNLNIGYDPATRLWDVIIKYSGPESGLAGNGTDPRRNCKSQTGDFSIWIVHRCNFDKW